MNVLDTGCQRAAYEEMNRLGGSPEGYLKQVIGLADYTLRELQGRLLI